LQAAPLPKPAVSVADPAHSAPADGVLDLDSLIQEVESVNPSLEAAVEAWQAAAFRYPQMIALEDPMFGFLRGTNEGFMVEASQKIPWPGKLRLRGNVAAAEADAMQWEVEDRRLMLAEATAMTFFDYYQADRQLEVNVANTRLLREFRDIAKTQYETGRVSQQDVLQADVELADLEARHVELQRERKIAAARINTLLHRAADHPLPPPPAKADVPDALPTRESVIERALQARPDLAAQMARIRQEEYSLGLAYKDYYPDLEFVFKHDHFMPVEMQTQVGMNFNVPVYRQKRHAAVCEASAKLRQRRAELESRMDQVRYEVQAAWERTSERRSVVRLYEKKILPAADANVQSARINYTAGKVDFLRLVEAERQLRQQQAMYHETVADYHRRLAELQRAVGAPLSQ
jgi:outer membrane protein TolC